MNVREAAQQLGNERSFGSRSTECVTSTVNLPTHHAYPIPHGQNTRTLSKAIHFLRYHTALCQNDSQCCESQNELVSDYRRYGTKSFMPHFGMPVMIRVLVLFSILFFSTVAPADDSIPELVEILQKASAFRPPARDLVWRQIPWHTDPSSAITQARGEKRPLFVWLAGGRDRDGTPLERC